MTLSRTHLLTHTPALILTLSVAHTLMCWLTHSLTQHLECLGLGTLVNKTWHCSQEALRRGDIQALVLALPCSSHVSWCTPTSALWASWIYP